MLAWLMNMGFAGSTPVAPTPITAGFIRGTNCASVTGRETTVKIDDSNCMVVVGRSADRKKP